MNSKLFRIACSFIGEKRGVVASSAAFAHRTP